MRLINHTILALTLSAFCSCQNAKEGNKTVANYPVMTIAVEDRTLYTDYTASITGCQTVEVRPQVDGLLTAIRIKEGDAVSRGEVLFVVDPAPYKAAYDIALANVSSAEAAVSNARLVYDSNRQLYDEKVVSEFELNSAKNELDQANARLRLAHAELDKAATNLSYTQVKSPVNGVASMIPYRVGALVSSNISQPLVTVSDDSSVYAYFSMAENQMLDLIGRYGSLDKAIADMPQVQLRMSNGEMYGESGRIDAVSGTINSTTGTVSLRAVFPNPSRMLHDGSTGTVLLPVERRNSIVVPQSATYELQDRVFVFKVHNGKTESAEVEILDLNNGREYVVLSGLAVGDSIISEGAGLIKEGTPVNPKKVEKVEKVEKEAKK